MKRRLVNLSAGASLAVLLILSWGFCSRFGAMVRNNAPTNVPPFYRETSAILEEGRFRIWIESWKSPPQGAIPAGRTIKPVGSVFDFRWPSPGRAIAEFDMHSIPPAITKGSDVFLIACPIWFIAAPFCVFPWLWFRAWRERRDRLKEEIVGFPISGNRGSVTET